MVGQMTNPAAKPIFPKTIIISITIALVLIFSSSCAGVGPLLKDAAVSFGQDLFTSALENHDEKYAEQLESLLLALVKDKTGVELEPKLGSEDEEIYEEEPYAEEEYSEAYSEEQYDQTEYAEPYIEETQGQGAYSPEYIPQERPVRYSASAPISMDVALLAQRRMPNGSVTMQAIQDGDTLYDGNGNPRAGDKIKVSFRANCNCYVYIIGVDATGWVAQIFPDVDSPFSNPVQSGRKYLMPQGDDWWGLDDYKGVETIYFIASYQRRTDIEYILADLAGNKRLTRKTYRPVTTAAVIPRTRGLVKVKDAAPINVQSQYGQVSTVTPTSFISTLDDTDLVISRWFYHR